MNQNDPVKLFICYSHEDQEFKDRLDKGLKPMVKFKKIEIQETYFGGTTEEDILSGIADSEIICLLVSQEYLNSEQYFTKKIEDFLYEKRKAGSHVVPIMLRATPFWENYNLSKLSALPKDGKPVNLWDNSDLVWFNIVTEIGRLAEFIQKSVKRPAGGFVSPPANEEEIDPVAEDEPPQPTPPLPAIINISILRGQIASGKLAHTIEELVKLTNERFPEMKNDAYLQLTRLNLLEQQISKGLITRPDADVQQTVITNSVLLILDSLEDRMQI